ncbi:MAG: hypothetical protein OEM21_10455 [Nitrosopumilus sp.]|nr:hypothetical protein [Nitrosopumilus sp.]
MSKTLKKNHSLQIAAICTIAVLAFGTSQFALAKDDSRIKLEGEFSNVDDGKAKFESRDNGDRKKFSVEISPVEANSEFTIAVGGIEYTATSDVFGLIDFNLDTQCEDDGSDCSDIPDLESGDAVTVTGNNFQTEAILS